MHNDSNFTTDQNTKATTSVGDIIYFSLNFISPIHNVVFTVQGKKQHNVTS